MVKECVFWHLQETVCDVDDIADILGTYVLPPDQANEYTDEEWSELTDRIAPRVFHMLKEAWMLIGGTL